MSFDYQQAEYHVQTRQNFPHSLKADCLDGAFKDWKSHPGFMIHAAGLHGFHNRLRDACDHFAHELAQEATSHDTDALINWRLLSYGQQIIDVAHSHHEAEDTVYFPRYVAQYNQLQRPLALLDGDHKVLNNALDDMQSAIKQVKFSNLRSDWDRATEQAQRLNGIINRHLDDEEEIVMPVLVNRYHAAETA